MLLGRQTPFRRRPCGRSYTSPVVAALAGRRVDGLPDLGSVYGRWSPDRPRRRHPRLGFALRGGRRPRHRDRGDAGRAAKRRGAAQSRETKFADADSRLHGLRRDLGRGHLGHHWSGAARRDLLADPQLRMGVGRRVGLLHTRSRDRAFVLRHLGQGPPTDASAPHLAVLLRGLHVPRHHPGNHLLHAHPRELGGDALVLGRDLQSDLLPRSRHAHRYLPAPRRGLHDVRGPAGARPRVPRRPRAAAGVVPDRGGPRGLWRLPVVGVSPSRVGSRRVSREFSAHRRPRR